MSQPLSEADLHWLAETMNHIQASTEEGMSLSMADGFFTALALSPEAVASTEWLAWVLAEELDLTELTNEQRLLSLLMQHYRRVQYVMRQLNPPEFEPIFLFQADSEQAWVAEWCHGFVTGVSLSQQAWQDANPREEDAMTLEILAGMSTLLPPDVDPGLYEQVEIGAEDEQAERMAQHMRMIAFDALETYREKLDPSAQWEDLLETCVMSLRDYMLHYNQLDDACPCGSGKAFTDCCGHHNRQLH